jgi:hypothetical protein
MNLIDIINQELYKYLKEDFKPQSSYLKSVIDDIKVSLNHNDELSDSDVDNIANANNVSKDDVLSALEYVKHEKNQPTKTGKETIDDFFDFLNTDPRVGSLAYLEYFSRLDRYLSKPKSNPMVGKFVKLTKYSFNWSIPYKDKVRRVNPDWVFQKRKGEYSKAEGGYESVLERDSRGDEVLPISPLNSNSKVVVFDDAGGILEILSSKEVFQKYNQYFRPSATTKYTPGSGVDFRSFKVKYVNALSAGGNKWNNDSLESDFLKLRPLFKKFSDFENIN